jgi:lipase chaperone LimK
MAKSLKQQLSSDEDENNFGYDIEKNDYPLEQQRIDMKKMMQNKEFADAIQSLKAEILSKEISSQVKVTLPYKVTK